MRWRHRVSVPCGDVDGDSEVWRSSARATFRVILLLRCMGRKWLWLELGSGLNVRVRAKLRCQIPVQCSGHQK